MINNEEINSKRRQILLSLLASSNRQHIRETQKQIKNNIFDGKQNRHSNAFREVAIFSIFMT
jgi:hypothetical protein